jgi:hypothetical protein
MFQMREKISYLATGLAIFLLVINILFVRIYTVAPTDLGLAGKLPISFWMGLAFVGIIWFTGKDSARILALALALSIAYLFFAPAIIRIPIWLSNSYYPFGESVLINSFGHLVNRASITLNSYHYWPLFLYFSSEFLQITGIPQYFVLKFFPLINISIYVLLTFLILKVKLKPTDALFGTGLFLTSFWLRQQYFGPPGIGYIFFLLGLLDISYMFFSDKREKNSLVALFVLVFIVTTLTHVLSSFMLLVVLIALYFAQRFAHKQESTNAFTLVIFSIVLLFFYNMFFASAFFNFAAKTYYKIITLSRELGLFKEPSRVAGSAAQVLNYRCTLAIMVICAVIALVGIFLTLRKQFSRRHSSIESYSLSWIMLLAFLAVFAVTVEYGPHEAYQRAFMFGLIPLSYFCVVVLSRKRKLFPVVILALLFLNIPAQYGADSYTLTKNSELAGAAFVAHKTPQNITCFYEFSLEIRYYDPLKNVKFLILESLPFTSIPNTSYIGQVFSKADYVIISNKQNNYYYYFLSQNPLDKVKMDNFNRLYDDSAFLLFKQANKTLP